MVGRERELRSLRDALARAVPTARASSSRSSDPRASGSRGWRPSSSRASTRRSCAAAASPYGEGITYWPVVEVLKQLDALPEDRCRGAPLRSLLGETEQLASAEEIAWGFRKLLEQEAQRDRSSASSTTSTGRSRRSSTSSSTSPTSRATRRSCCSAWPGRSCSSCGRPGAAGSGTRRRSARAARRGRDGAAARGARRRRAASCAERISAPPRATRCSWRRCSRSSGESRRGEVEVPPTIQALLAARLDQLDPAERAVLERGVGRGPDLPSRAPSRRSADGDVEARALTALVRKQLVRPDRGAVPRRRRLPLPPSPDPRRGLRRAPEERRAPTCTDASPLARRATERLLSSSTRSSATTSSRRRGTSPSSAGPTRASPSGGKRARRRRAARALARADRTMPQRSLLGRALVRSPTILTFTFESISPWTVRYPREQARICSEIARRRAEPEPTPRRRVRANDGRLLCGWAATRPRPTSRSASPSRHATAGGGREDRCRLADLWFCLANGVYNFRCRSRKWNTHPNSTADTRYSPDSSGSGGDFAVALIFGPQPTAEALSTVDEPV